MEATQTAAAPVATTNFVSKLANDGSMTNEETVEIEILKQHQNQPAIPKATSLLFNSGNVVASERFLLKKKTNTSPQEELHDVLNKTFAAWLSVVDRANVKDLKTVQCRHPEFYERLSDEANEEELSISVKIFLNSFNEQTFNDALQIIMDEIGCKRLDTVILSFPDKIFNEEEWETLSKTITTFLLLSKKTYHLYIKISRHLEQ